jgi:hypothetical protein
MTMHIGKLTHDVTLHDADATLSPAQIEKIVTLVLARLEERAREARRSEAATTIHRQASKPTRMGGGC